MKNIFLLLQYPVNRPNPYHNLIKKQSFKKPTNERTCTLGNSITYRPLYFPLSAKEGMWFREFLFFYLLILSEWQSHNFLFPPESRLLLRPFPFLPRLPPLVFQFTDLKNGEKMMAVWIWEKKYLTKLQVHLE